MGSAERPNETTRDELHLGPDLLLDDGERDQKHAVVAPTPSPPVPPAPVPMPRPAKLPPLPAPPQVNLKNDPSIRVPPPLPSLLAPVLKPYTMAPKVKPPSA